MAMMTRSVNYLNSMRCPALGHLNLIDSSGKSPFLLVKSMHSRVDCPNIATHLWGSQCTLFWVASIVKISFVSGGVRSWWVGFRHERWKSGKKHENEISCLPVLKLLKSQSFGIKHISLCISQVRKRAASNVWHLGYSPGGLYFHEKKPPGLRWTPQMLFLVWPKWLKKRFPQFSHHLGMDQYLYIPFLGGWPSIYQLFWCSPGVQGFDTLPFLAKCWIVVSPVIVDAGYILAMP